MTSLLLAIAMAASAAQPIVLDGDETKRLDAAIKKAGAGAAFSCTVYKPKPQTAAIQAAVAQYLASKQATVKPCKVVRDSKAPAFGSERFKLKGNALQFRGIQD